MEAWQFTKPGKPAALREVPDSELHVDGVVVDVKAAGLCHTDVSLLDGTLSDLVPFSPFTLGHEVAGVVSAVGSNVTSFSIGDRIVVPVGDEGPGTTLNGGFASTFACPASLLRRIPDGVDWDQAATATDAGLTAHQAVIGKGRVGEGSRVGIIGFGGLGSLGAQIARAVGAEVFVADTSADARQYADSLGVSGVSSRIADFADEELDVIVDFVGMGGSVSEAISAVRKQGRVILVGLGAAEGVIPFHHMVLNDIQLIGSIAGTPEDCESVLALMAAGQVRSRISRIAFSDIGEGLARLAAGDVTGRLVAISD